MDRKRTILIVGGGTAGWLTAAYLARFLQTQGPAAPHGGAIEITVLESPDIGIVGVGEAAFPTLRSTLQFLGLDEARFMRDTHATFKQGIRFNDWLEPPASGKRHHYLHPFEAPVQPEGANLVPYWLLQDEAERAPFAEAVTIQAKVACARRAPKLPHEEGFEGPLNYAYHFDATGLAEVLADRARELGVRHLADKVVHVEVSPSGRIDHLVAEAQGRMEADLYIDCTGFRAELIGKALGSPLSSVREVLFADRAISCRVPYGPNSPLESYTLATAHAAGWIWDIGLTGGRGVGCVYSSRHMDDDAAEAVLRGYVGEGGKDLSVRKLAFEPGYRPKAWIGNCVAVGLASGFLEPLESTGLVLIEAAAAMIAELFPHNGPIDAPARRFNELMSARYDNIVAFLKLHYCLSRRPEPFWRDNADPATIPERLRDLLEQWRYRPPNRFDFTLDVETFAFFNYQYILYGMGFRTDLSPGRNDFPDMRGAEKLFARIQAYGERAAHDLPGHRELIEAINGAGLAKSA